MNKSDNAIYFLTKYSSSRHKAIVLLALLAINGCKENTPMVNKVQPDKFTSSTKPLEQTEVSMLIEVQGQINLRKSCGALPAFDKKSCTGSEPAAIHFTLVHLSSQQSFKMVSDTNGQVAQSLPAGDYLVTSQGPMSVTPSKLTITQQSSSFELNFQPKLR